MARIVAGFASSHSVMLTCTLEDWQKNFRAFDPKGRFFDRQGNAVSYAQLLALAPPDANSLVTDEAIAARYAQVQDAMGTLRAKIRAADLDCLIICGDDQNELFSSRLQPAIALYHGQAIRNAARRPVDEGGWYKRAQMQRLEEFADAHYPVRGDLGLHLTGALIEAGFDVASMDGLSGDQYEGHAFSFVHRFYLDGLTLPIVPVFLNTYFAPNQPTPRRCVELGRAVARAVGSFSPDLKIGFMASGGLSHFQAEEDLDHAVLDALKAKDIGTLASLDVRRLQAGSSEIRNWLVLAGACERLDLDWLSYTPGYRTEALTGTGLGFAAWS
ncbi:MAG: extradiol ring-cleavage dioxygenase [Beijerinckiaceae bacterium]|nr:extradiol ring-cleavage dioxygenase [Beijerinckiaceae bacterium]